MIEVQNYLKYIKIAQKLVRNLPPRASVACLIILILNKKIFSLHNTPSLSLELEAVS